MTNYISRNQKEREKVLKKGEDFYYASVETYERRHTECDSTLVSNLNRESSHDVECKCSKWKYDYITGKFEKYNG